MKRISSYNYILLTLLIVGAIGICGWKTILSDKEYSFNVIVPLYHYDSPEEWQKLGALINEWPMIKGVVLPNSSNIDAGKTAINEMLKAGGIRPKIYGYVHLNYGKRPLKDIYADISKYYASLEYFNGVFFDEVPREATTTLKTDSAVLFFFNLLKSHIRREASKKASLLKYGPKKLNIDSSDMDEIILNPGTGTVIDYMGICDILVNAEKFSCNSACPPNYSEEAWKYLQPAWVQNYPPDRFYHIIHSISSVEEMKENIRLAKKRNVSWLFLTDRSRSCTEDPGVYNNLPSAEFLKTMLKELAK